MSYTGKDFRKMTKAKLLRYMVGYLFCYMIIDEFVVCVLARMCSCTVLHVKVHVDVLAYLTL